MRPLWRRWLQTAPDICSSFPALFFNVRKFKKSCRAKQIFWIPCHLILSLITLTAQELYIKHRLRASPKREATFGSKEPSPESGTGCLGQERGGCWIGSGLLWAIPPSATSLEKPLGFLQIEVWECGPTRRGPAARTGLICSTCTASLPRPGSQTSLHVRSSRETGGAPFWRAWKLCRSGGA